jgi:hypothetical protein
MGQPNRPMPVSLGDIANRFTYHAPKPAQTARYEEIRAQARTFAEYLRLNCPPSREAALALTHLDEVVMWANAAIARHEP